MKILQENKNDIAIVADIKRLIRKMVSKKNHRFPTMTRTTRFTILGALFLLVSLTALTIYLQTNHKAEAAWYNTGWGYRQGITVTVPSNSSDIINLETLLTINTATLMNAGKLQSSCQDLRFTSTTGTSLPYYIDSGCNTTTTKVWVAVDKVPANTTTYTLYMYYGNPSASSGSNSTRFDLFKGLAGYWPMNETANSWNNTSGEVKDASVNGNNGTGVSFSSTSPTTSGKLGNAGLFNGSQYVTLPTSAALNITTDITLSAWVKVTTSGAVQEIIGGYSDSTNQGYELGIWSSGAVAYWNGSAYVTVGPTVGNNAWHFVAVSISNTTGTWYVDGSSVGTASTTRPSSFLGTRSLGASQNGVQKFAGTMDDVRIYNRALSATEINQLYTNPGTLASTLTTNSNPTITFAAEEKSTAPALYYKFDEGTGSLANNSGFGGNGTLTNGLVGYWKMDEAINSWNGTTGEVKDYSASGNNGTSVGFTGTSSPIGGVYGNAGSFNGSTQYVTLGNVGLNGSNSFTISAWIKPAGSCTTANPGAPFDFGGNALLQSVGMETCGGTTGRSNYVSIGGFGYAFGTASNTLTPGVWNHVVITYSGGAVSTGAKIYINGIQQSITNDQTNDGTLNLSNTNYAIGRIARANVNYFNGLIDDTRIYNRALSSTEVQSLYTYGLNASNANLSGTTNPTWQTDDQCISGKCLYFNGITSNVASTASVSAQTVSFWAKPATSSAALVGLSPGVDIYASSGVVGIDGFTSPTIYVNGKQNGLVTPNNWNQIEVTTATPINANQITIGQMQRGVLNGLIDEFKLYTYPRTATQVAADYNSRGTLNAGSNVLGIAANNTPALNNGLLGYWKMDEPSWNGTAGEVKDASGNSNNGTSQASATTTTGKFGNGGSFNGSSQYIAVANTISGVQSVAFWINPTSVTSLGTIQLTSSAYITVSSGTITATGFTSPQIYVNGVASTTLSTGSWQHVVITSTTGIASNAIQFAKANSIFTNATMDEVRFYNRTLSPSDVQIIYNYLPGPVGYYTFDEGSGTTVYDRSGGANNGVWQGTLGNQWKPGKYSLAGNFINTNSNYVALTPPGNAFNVKNYVTVEGWVNLSTIDASGNARRIFATNTWAFGIYHNGLEYTTFGIKDYQLTGAFFTTNKWYYIAVIVDSSSNANFYINGSLVGTVATGGNPSAPSSAYNIGYSANDGVTFAGKIDDLRIYNYDISLKQMNQDMNLNETESNVSVGGNRSAPVGYWKFDEGYGTVAHNGGNGGGALNGTLTNSPIWNENGKFGKALQFNGVNQYVALGSRTGLNFTNTDLYTISTWINTKTTPGDIFGADQGSGSYAGYDLFVYNNVLRVQIINTTGSNMIDVHGSKVVTDGKWHQVIMTYNGSSKATGVSLYVDGQIDPITITTNTLTGATTTATVPRIGFATDGVSYPFNGLIDDLKVYASALSSAEIQQDYNHNSGLNLGSLGTAPDGKTASNSASAVYCIPGDTSTCAAPVGEWNFDEGAGTAVNDTSGSNDLGTWNGTGKTHWVKGKSGFAGNFNGSTDYVSLAANTTIGLPTATSALTVGAWIKTTATDGDIVSLRNLSVDNTLFNLQVGNTTVGNAGTGKPALLTRDDAGSSITQTVGSNAINDGKWHYVVAVRTSSKSDLIYVDGQLTGSATDAMTGATTVNWENIGKETKNSGLALFNGQIDNVKIYNYARTPAQILWDYNRGAPMGWWKMDECQGGVINDASGNGIVGTIHIGASGSQTALGTCNDGNTAHAWNNGTIGKFNNSLSFDGTDDYVSLTNQASVKGLTGFSYSAWVKINTLPTSGNFLPVIYEPINTDSQSTRVSLDVANNVIGATGTKFAFIFRSADSTLVTIDGLTTPVSGQWYHLVGTFDGVNQKYKLYVNGSLEASTTGAYTMSSTNPNVPPNIGFTNNTQYFSGQIDDTRIYNYALTPYQVQTLYNGGAAVRFGPAVGSP